LIAQNNTLLFDLLDDVKFLPDDELLLKHESDKASFWDGPTGECKTTWALSECDVDMLSDLQDLRKGDTRTIVVVCSPVDRRDPSTGAQLIASMERCVLIIYPQAFKNHLRISDLDPRTAHIDQFLHSLAGVLYHELNHFFRAQNGEAL
jgi:hypothetical protein